MIEKKDLTTRDWLAIERTRLANERTFLAYFRTFVVILGTGIAILKLDILHEIKTFGIILITISPIILVIGIIRLVYVKKKIKQYYKV
ncbi:DUF202 domain-containing protein [Oceanihabitans sediminis]|uniref:DUF202 domain-containing protein n=1 Tax=Oceanihabitans sediminis TaxID=1812012 RepID=A0A368P298_9FLAO|nr:DUF202 domain-containing protein [Oceanihabitans sediminis]MDX1277688.1 DUF202 domain-containing protein [Oceanihabitans sediminis]MDX1774462.1 DUF202 domain-containing protein [Oceanihabitans sediminis]RBP27748.1 putative membrane protein [Oceanihabitans sediminis]RCU56536.1 DUF202 domain-containing protein [Oceanihabitans sediminis]